MDGDLSSLLFGFLHQRRKKAVGEGFDLQFNTTYT